MKLRHSIDPNRYTGTDRELALAVQELQRGAATNGNGEGGGNDLESKTRDELAEIAEARGLEVTRGDGKEGAPLKADYIAALSGADGA